MKHSPVFFTLIGLLLLGLIANAQPGPRGKPGERMAKMLDLNEQQKGQWEDLHLKLRKEMIPLRTELQSLRGELNLLATADNFNRNQVEKLVEQMQKLRSDMQIKHLLHQQAVRRMLTPEQRKRFDMHILSGKHRGRKGGCWGCDQGPGHHGRRGPKGEHGMGFGPRWED